MRQSTPSEPEPTIPTLTTYPEMVADYNAFAELHMMEFRLAIGPPARPVIVVDRAGNEVKG